MNLFLQVVSPEVLDNVKVEGIISNIKTYTISSWGTTDPQTRLKKEENSKEAKKSGSMFIKKEMPKQKIVGLRRRTPTKHKSALPPTRVFLPSYKNNPHGNKAAAAVPYFHERYKYDIPTSYYIQASWEIKMGLLWGFMSLL